MDILLYYVGIGLVLALPLISLVQNDDEAEPVNTREVFLTIFFWPWLWVLLGQMFFNFIKNQLCIKTK